MAANTPNYLMRNPVDYSDNAPAPTGGGSGIDWMSLFGGAGSGAAAGTAVMPGLGTAIGAGLDLIGSGIGAYQKGQQEDAERAEAQKRYDDAQARQARLDAQNLQMQQQNSALAGVNELAGLSGDAEKNARTQVWRNGLSALVRGA